MKILTFIATASLVASGSLVAFSSSAQASLYTTCVGDGGAVTVSNDLVVPAGKSCTLTGTKVKGTVTVEAGADLVAAGATFNGAVTVEENAYLDLTDTTVKGALRTNSAFGAHLEKSNLKEVDATQGFVYVVDSTLGGNVSAEAGELYVSGSTLSGSLTGDGNQYSDVYDTTVKGALTVNGNTLGGVFCASEVYGAAKYAGNADNLQLGGESLLDPARAPRTSAATWRSPTTPRRPYSTTQSCAAGSPRPATIPSWSWESWRVSVAPSPERPPPPARRPPARPRRRRRRTVVPTSPRRPPPVPPRRGPTPTRRASPASDAERDRRRHTRRHRQVTTAAPVAVSPHSAAVLLPPPLTHARSAVFRSP